MQKKLKELESIVAKRIKKAEMVAEKTKKDAQELARSAISSWSIAGERSLAEGQAQINEDNLVKLKNLLSEVNESQKKEGSSISPISYVVVKANGKTDSFYLVENPVHLPGVKLVSTNSPMGSLINGKKVGDLVDLYGTKIAILSCE